jgi:hypothetical protein
MKPEKTASSGKLWAWVPALLLGSMFVGLGSMAYVAVDDPHFALEPNYYEKAVHWDQAQESARRSAKSGMTVTLEPLVESPDGNVEVRFRIGDQGTKPAIGASVVLEAFPNAYANHVQRLVLEETAPGVYTGRLRRASLGLWELRLSATQGTAHFEQIFRQDVAKGNAA